MQWHDTTTDVLVVWVWICTLLVTPSSGEVSTGKEVVVEYRTPQCLPGGQQKEGTVKIGLILPEHDSFFPWSHQRTRPAIDYAIEYINTTGILPGYTIETTFGDSFCSDTYGPLKAIDMYLHGQANIFLGPVCDYAVATIARLSPYWNIPLISPGARVFNFNSKRTYSLLTRIGGTYSNLGHVLFRIMENFNFQKIGLAFYVHKGANSKKDKTTEYFIMEAVFHTIGTNIARKYGRQASKDNVWYTNFDEKTVTPKETEQILHKIRLNRRSKQILILLFKCD